MAKPQPRTPHTALPAAVPDAPALPTGPDLRPAPDNGVDYVDRAPGAASTAEEAPRRRGRRGKGVRDYPQLGTRVPPELLERIERACDEADLTQTALVRQAITEWLTAHGY